MYTFLQKQYELVTSSRTVLFSYCETIKPEDLLKPMLSFNNESMVTQMIHTANCYLFWLSNCAMQQQRPFFTIAENKDLNAIRLIYANVDLTINDFLKQFDKVFESSILFCKQDGNKINCAPLDIFTHVITHEFHHKGQIISMSRHMGYLPVDTDVIRS